jgi:hypothetical protein
VATAVVAAAVVVPGYLPWIQQRVALADSCSATQMTFFTIRQSGGVNAEVDNFLNVEGLQLHLFVDQGIVNYSYSMPSWLLDADGGNTSAIEQEIASGRLHDRCPLPAAA